MDRTTVCLSPVPCIDRSNDRASVTLMMDAIPSLPFSICTASPGPLEPSFFMIRSAMWCSKQSARSIQLNAMAHDLSVASRCRSMIPTPRHRPLNHNHQALSRSMRLLSAETADQKKDSPTNADLTFSSPAMEGLYAEITKLPEREVNVLGALVLQMLGRKIYPGEFGGGGGAVSSTDVVEEAEVKSAFDVMLVGLADQKAKIKVIKEVRAILSLGLKEAKELVEAAPKAVQKGLKTEQAEELKQRLEAVGAQIELQ